MEKNEMIQWSIVVIIVLLAIVLAAIHVIKTTRRKGNGCNCGGCSDVKDCKLKELKDEIKNRQQ